MAFCTWSAAACSPVGYDSRASLSVPPSRESLVVDLDNAVLELRSVAAPVGEGRGVDWVEVREEASACSPRIDVFSRALACPCRDMVPGEIGTQGAERAKSHEAKAAS